MNNPKTTENYTVSVLSESCDIFFKSLINAHYTDIWLH